MGLFDFLKSKRQTQPTAEQQKAFSEYQDLVLTTMNSLLGDKTNEEIKDDLRKKGLTDEAVELVFAKAMEMNKKFFDKG